MDTNFQISGPADAPALVLSHSLATNLSMWDRVEPYLAGHFRVIRYDTRGHGATPNQVKVPTLADLERDVVELLDHLSIPRAHFAGLSLGGLVGLGLALDHPGRLISLVVCDAGPGGSVAARANWDERIAQVSSNGIDVIIESTLERWFGEAFRADAKAMEWMRAIVKNTTPRGYIDCARVVQAFDIRSRLGAIAAPTLLLTGENDSSAPPSVVQAMHQLIPNSRFVALPGAGHLSAAEQPAAFAAAVTHFLTSAA